MSFKTTGAEEAFLFAYGRALTEWQKVESACYKIYYQLMRGTDPRLISVTWFHIQSFESRTLLLDRCLYFSIDDADMRKRHWTPLKKCLDAQGAVRNFLVHGAFSVEGADYPLLGEPVIKPDHFDAIAIIRKRKLNPDFRFTADDVLNAARDFQRLAHALSKFLTDLIGGGFYDPTSDSYVIVKRE